MKGIRPSLTIALTARWPVGPNSSDVLNLMHQTDCVFVAVGSEHPQEVVHLALRMSAGGPNSISLPLFTFAIAPHKLLPPPLWGLVAEELEEVDWL